MDERDWLDAVKNVEPLTMQQIWMDNILGDLTLEFRLSTIDGVEEYLNG